MAGKRPAVVFLPGQAAALAQEMRVARAMATEGNLRPVVVMPRPLPGEPEDGVDGVRVVRLHSGGAVKRAGTEHDQETADEAAAETRSGLGRLVRETLPAVHLRARRRAARLRAEAARMAALLRAEGAQALVVSDDRRSGITLAMLRAARDVGVGSVLIPYAHAHPVGSATIRLDRPIHMLDAPPMRAAKRHVAERFPEQVYAYRGQRLLFYGPVGTLALHAAGQLPENPWWPGGGLTDVVCVLSDAARDDRIGGGIAADRIVVTGDVALDDLFAAHARRDELRTHLSARHGLMGDRPVVILAPPQLAEQGVLPWPEHREQMADLVRRTVAGGADVLLSLHPKTRRSDYAFLDDIAGMHVLDESLADALPAADLFVASRSSTVEWAIALGIPPLVADFGWLGHDTWDDTEGVTVVTERDAFDAAIGSLLNDEAARRRAREGLAREAQRRSRFDGHATERTLAVIAQAVTGRGGSATVPIEGGA